MHKAALRSVQSNGRLTEELLYSWPSILVTPTWSWQLCFWASASASSSVGLSCAVLSCLGYLFLATVNSLKWTPLWSRHISKADTWSWSLPYFSHLLHLPPRWTPLRAVEGVDCISQSSCASEFSVPSSPWLCHPSPPLFHFLVLTIE